MADAGERHGDAPFVGGGDHLLVAHRAARLDHRGGARLDRRRARRRRRGRRRRTRPPSPSQGSRASPPPSPLRRPSSPRCGLNRPGSSARRRCRPSRRPWRRRWRSTSHAWRRGRRRSDRAIPASVGARLVTTRSSMSSTTALSRDCTRKPPATAAKVRPAARGSGRPPVSSRRRFFLRADDGDGVLVGLRRDDDLGENLDDLRRRPRVERAGSGRRCRR